jgi:hypothetical protein
MQLIVEAHLLGEGSVHVGRLVTDVELRLRLAEAELVVRYLENGGGGGGR